MVCLLVHGWMTGRVWSGFAPMLAAGVVAPTSTPPPSEIATTTLELFAEAKQALLGDAEADR